MSSVKEKSMDDPHLWLENIEDHQALQWAKQQNEITTSHMQKQPYFNEIYDKNLEILNSDDRIAYPTIRRDYLYNFWQDAKNERGIWRRAKYDDYFNGGEWEELLDLDKLSKQENESWVFKGAEGLYPDYEKYMIKLSRGGGDATVVREYDITTKSFVENGFELPEAKSFLAWYDKDTLWVASDFGKDSLTNSGYPMSVREWKRGTELIESNIVFRGEKQDIGSYSFVIHTDKHKYKLIIRAKTFYSAEYHVFYKDNLQLLDVPDDCKLTGFLQEYMIIQLKSDWTLPQNNYKAGSILVISFEEFMNGSRNFDVVVVPEDDETVTSIQLTKNYIVINKLKNVRSQLYHYNIYSKKLNQVPTSEYGSIHLITSDDNSDSFFYTYSDFLTPPTLHFFQNDQIKKIRQLPHFFSSDNFQVQQFMANSTDEAKIPYFVVSSKDTQLNGKNPTLIKAYGGFEVSLYPHYLGTIGTSWLQRGGVYIVANIRGGGEFGPKWHRCALKENRQRCFDDLAAVAKDISHRKISSAKYTGIIGGSNGGLLVGAAFTQKPELYGAVVCQVPLLDMQRYHKLLAGASWVAEYGNPDIEEEWEYIKKYSPYHNLSPDKEYPVVFIYTSTKDDRVHPGHARKMVARMQEMDHKVYYYENLEGGHAGATTHHQQAFASALSYCYLWEQLE
ncbi:prolyl oligopeptidase family protein [Candidatus Uabimicrobium sp. HlEnr_7]|uniref:prolyl oligopeptidase family serine peptidase n=1 Tax=Candidatus Uabimicrobium helgolandensis TaxID=3095367 RepID=UPI003555F4F5